VLLAHVAQPRLESTDGTQCALPAVSRKASLERSVDGIPYERGKREASAEGELLESRDLVLGELYLHADDAIMIPKTDGMRPRWGQSLREWSPRRAILRSLVQSPALVNMRIPEFFIGLPSMHV
jgi:hypothetical protein